MDSNIRQLLDEIYKRDGIDGLKQYASRDTQSKSIVEEYVFNEDENIDLTLNGYTGIPMNPEDDYTSRCSCGCFWYPGSVTDKCMECGNTDQTTIEKHTGYVEFSYLDGSGSYEGLASKSNKDVKPTFILAKQSRIKKLLSVLNPFK